MGSRGYFENAGLWGRLQSAAGFSPPSGEALGPCDRRTKEGLAKTPWSTAPLWSRLSKCRRFSRCFQSRARKQAIYSISASSSKIRRSAVAIYDMRWPRVGRAIVPAGGLSGRRRPQTDHSRSSHIFSPASCLRGMVQRPRNPSGNRGRLKAGLQPGQSREAELESAAG
jgi:hypothetical protein